MKNLANRPWSTVLSAALCSTIGSTALAAGPDWGKATTATPATSLATPMPAPTARSMQASSAMSGATLPKANAAPTVGSAFARQPAVAPALSPANAPTNLPTNAPTTALTSAPPSKTGIKAGMTTVAVRDLFQLDDRTPITVDGKPSSAGAVKQAIKAELVAKAGPAKTVRALPRKVDVASMNVMNGGLGVNGGIGHMQGAGPAPARTAGNTRTLATPPNVAMLVPGAKLPAGTQLAANARAGNDAALATLCVDKGPPKISEVEGKLRPGNRLKIWGTCFGDKPGHIEVIGQFPGGKLVPSFASWDMTGVVIEVPANIRGALDHYVTVTVVTADNKPSPAMQAQFVASREKVEVPDRLWSVEAGFELASTEMATDFTPGHSAALNKAASGRVTKTVRVNPQCALDAMGTESLSGTVTRLSGFEQGPPNEATVAIDWVGTCSDLTTTRHINYVILQEDAVVSVVSSCRVAFKASATAYCPSGVAP